jgi:hypothetical protein
MIRKLLTGSLLLLSLVACKSRSGFKFSQDIVAKEKALEPALQKTESDVKNFFAESKYDSIVAVSEKMENMVQQKIDEIKNASLPDAKGVDNFRSAALKYFSFIKSIYTAYKEYGLAATDEERQAAAERSQKIADERMEALKDIQEAQQKYAKDNGFRVENKY